MMSRIKWVMAELQRVQKELVDMATRTNGIISGRRSWPRRRRNNF